MIVTVTSWKGGTGKTTLIVLLAYILASRGKRVLIIDLDSNCAISASVYGVYQRELTSMEFLLGTGEGFDGIVNVKENIDIMPSKLQNAMLANIMDSQLKRNIKRAGFLEKYDYILVDPPGFWCSHTKNAVIAADTLIVPGMCSRLDYEATTLYFNTLEQCGIEANVFVCVNAFSQKTNLPGIHEKYKASFGEFLLPEIPYIQSLKKITDDVQYDLHPSVKKRLNAFINQVIGADDTIKEGEAASA